MGRKKYANMKNIPWDESDYSWAFLFLCISSLCFMAHITCHDDPQQFKSNINGPHVWPYSPFKEASTSCRLSRIQVWLGSKYVPFKEFNSEHYRSIIAFAFYKTFIRIRVGFNQIGLVPYFLYKGNSYRTIYILRSSPTKFHWPSGKVISRPGPLTHTCA